MPHENSATNETEFETRKEAKQSDLLESPFCQKNCKICSSPYRTQIMELLKSDMKYRDIVQYAKDNFGITISISSLSRHQQNYRRAIRSLIHRQEFENFDQTAETAGKHQKQVLFLMNATFKSIMNHLEAGSLVLGIDEFEKLTKLYYNIVRDPEAANDNDIVALFQKASNKQGFDIHQGLLFKPKKHNE